MTSGFRARSSTYTDPLNPRFDRGLADFDSTHRLVVSWGYQIPWDKPFRSGNAFLRKMTEGWTINGIAQFQSGNPFTLYQNNNSGELNNYLDRPDVIGPVQIFHDPHQIRTFTLPANSSDPTSPGYDPLHYSCVTANGTDASGNPTVTGMFYFNPANIVCSVGVPGGVPLFSHGNMGRNVLRGPGINNWDLSLLKDFKLSESKSLEFRTEFFNAFNHTQFLSPTLQAGIQGFSSNFGQVTADRGGRIIQFAMKFYY